MAKSLRSKRKQKMKAEKRVKYAKKALDKLKDTITKTQITMTTDMVKFKKLDELEKEAAEREKAEAAAKKGIEVKMETGEDVWRDPKTLRNKSGKFPAWMTNKEKRHILRKLKKAKRQKKRLSRKMKGKKR